VVIGGVFLLGIVAAAGYAARALPAGARVPVNLGMPEYSLWLPKLAGLAAWLGAGVVTFAAFAALTLNSLAANWATSLRVVLLPCAMLLVLAAEAGAVITARRCADDRLPAATPVAEPVAEPETEPEAALEAEPVAAAEAEPEAAPEAEPEAALETVPGMAAESAPEAAPESE